MRRVLAYDTTLRDGAQSPGVAFSSEDMLAIARVLDDVGMDVVELGNPGANAADLAIVRAAADTLRRAKVAAFGMTCRAGGDPAADEGLARLCDSGAAMAAIVGKASAMHVERVLRVPNAEALRMIGESVRYVASRGMAVIFDAEHFFDGWHHDAVFAFEALRAALNGGACALALCDTNGGSLPWDVAAVIEAVQAEFPGVALHFHGHNDAGLATASSLAAVRAGAQAVQGTIGGLGERCGNADLCQVLPGLALKLGCEVLDGRVERLSDAMRSIFDILNLAPPENQPYVGANAFAHKAGMHIDGVMKHSCSFEHVDPEAVGNRRRLILSAMSGRGALLRQMEDIAPGLSKHSPEVQALVARLKEEEAQGLSYEGADASFALMVQRARGSAKRHFDVLDFHVISTGTATTATVKVAAGGRIEMTAAEGDGPINALDLALRKALCVFYPHLAALKLVDYKVRVLQSGAGTASRVRVVIQSADAAGAWGTVGVSSNIIEASFHALCDAIECFLNERGATPDEGIG